VAALPEVTGLRKSFGRVAALRGGQFGLEDGTVQALGGGNGAGKSTFLSIVMGICRRDGGTIWRNGREVEFNTGKIPGAEPAAKRLAVHARKLALEPNLQILRRHRRSLLRRMEALQPRSIGLGDWADAL
jgi:putative xylitol transport system ATP-binding protein